MIHLALSLVALIFLVSLSALFIVGIVFCLRVLQALRAERIARRPPRTREQLIERGARFAGMLIPILAGTLLVVGLVVDIMKNSAPP